MQIIQTEVGPVLSLAGHPMFRIHFKGEGGAARAEAIRCAIDLLVDLQPDQDSLTGWLMRVRGENGETAKKLETEGFRELVGGSTVSLDDFYERAKTNCYPTAGEAFEAGLIGGVLT